MILVDTSAWVEFDRATASPFDRRVAELITLDAQVAVTEPVVMEGEALALRGASRQVHVSAELLDYLVRLAEASRHSPQVELGVSPRAALALLVGSTYFVSVFLFQHHPDLLLDFVKNAFGGSLEAFPRLTYPIWMVLLIILLCFIQQTPSLSDSNACS